jgi:putative spermidine/putrescine transport system substrate-binding protein
MEEKKGDLSMRNNKRIVFSLLATAVVLSVLAAQCVVPAAPQTVVETVVVEKEVVKEVEKVVEVPAEKEIDLVYMTAGDVNMLALAQNLLAAEYKKVDPSVNLRTVHTGPGDAGSRLIFEKMVADKQAGKETGDVDVAMVHQAFMTWATEEGDLLLKYAPDLETYQYVTAADAKNALGANVEGYVMPMFHSQTALAYDPAVVTDPPTSYEELVEWVKQNPGKFGYNGIKGGMSGVSFTVGWLYWKTGNYEKYAVTGPFDEAEVDTWTPALEDMKDFNEYVTFTAGNVGTLDALNRGEIAMGPVWVDMFYTFMLEGKLDPNMKLVVPEPGMPGQPMYFVIPANAPHPEQAKQFVEYVTSPRVQGEVIIDRYNWYPGIDGKFVQDSAPPEAFDRLYQDISPETLSQFGLSFPLADYFTAMLEAYERVVIGGGG